MSKASDPFNQSVVGETGKYNTSKLYAELMVMKLLYSCQEMREICYHGTSNIVEEFIMDSKDKTKAKIEGLERYVTYLLSLTINCLGQVKTKSRDILKAEKLRLEIIHENLPKIRINNSSQNYEGTYEWTDLNYTLYGLLLKEMNLLFERITEILTLENMIHYNIPEFDEDKAKEKYTQNFTQDG